MNTLKKQLRALKNHQAFGAVDELRYRQEKNRVMSVVRAEAQTIEIKQEIGVQVGGHRGWSYASWLMSQYVSRPAVAGAFSIAMVASGWMATARAAESLPGDTLYSVKILTERAKLSLASADRKAVLHTEFAQNRLQEATRLQSASADQPERNPLVAQALEAYEMELAYAGEELMALSGEATLSTVASIQENLNSVDTALDATLAQTDDLTESSQVLAAKEATQEASRLAASVAVDVHDKAPSEESTIALKETFKQKLGDLEARQQFDLQRVTVIEGMLSELDPEVIANDPILSAEQTRLYVVTIEDTEKAIGEAMEMFAAGGYKTAFATFDEASSSLLAVEASLAQIEIAIMNIKATPPATEPVDTPAEEPADQSIDEAPATPSTP